MSELLGLFTEKSKPVPLMGVRVKGDIRGRGAKITVGQRFRNEEKTPVEAVYRFPLPEGAAVCGFKVWIDERVIQGQVEEREKAFERYDEALIKGDGAYLMDQERPNIFTLSVGNLNPETEAVIEMELVLLLDMEGPKIRFFLPTTISPRYIPEDLPEMEGIPEQERIHPPYASEVPYGLSLILHVHQPDFLSSIESPTHPVKVGLGTDPVQVTFSQETVKMDRDFILYIGTKNNFLNRAYQYRSGEAVYLQLDLLLTEDHKDDQKEKTRKEIIFLLDCSGSMQGDSIREAKMALEICLRALQSGTEFNIYRFGSTYTSLFRRSEPYSKENLDKAVQYLKNTQADLGGTELLEPLKKIYSTPPVKKDRAILLLTDGEVGNEEEIMELVGENPPQTRLFPVGIGAGPNAYLIKGLARASRGAWEFIFPGERIEPKVLRIFEKIASRSLDKLVVDWPLENLEQAPQNPAIFLNFPQTIFARLKAGDFPAGPLKVKGIKGNKEQIWDIEMVKEESGGTSIPVLWARERIRDLEDLPWGLMDSGSRQEERKSKKRKEMVINLSKGYKLLSKYTSYVAIEERKEKDKTTGNVVLRRIPALLTTGWHGGGSVSGFFSLRTPSASSAAQFSISEDADFRESYFCLKTNDAHLVSAPREKINTVLTILSVQRAEGGFLFDHQVAEALGIDEIEIKEYARDLTADLLVDSFLLLSTAILILILETYFEDQSSLWRGSIKKSQDWLDQFLKQAHPMIYGQDLSSWVEWYVKDQIQLS